MILLHPVYRMRKIIELSIDVRVNAAIYNWISPTMFTVVPCKTQKDRENIGVHSKKTGSRVYMAYILYHSQCNLLFLLP